MTKNEITFQLLKTFTFVDFNNFVKPSFNITKLKHASQKLLYD